MRNKRKGFRIGVVVGIVVLVAVACLIYISSTKNREFKLTRSTGNVRVTTAKSSAEVTDGIKNDLQFISVNDIFHKYDTCIVKGTVKKIQYLKVQVGAIETARALVSIQTKKVIRGQIKVGKEVKILVPIASTIATVSDQIEVGMEGIFMPVKYDESGEEYFIQNQKSKLVLKDISDYGLINGVDWLFLEKDGKCIFDKDKYKDIQNAKSLDEIQQYIQKQIS